ncbi:MAG: FHA domain-containing protein [Thermoleophilia bacterium]|nr:FHA domain-containing protein [Thermoleophilia bacterium]
MILCPACGVENMADSNFCRRCGSRLKAVNPAEITLAYSLGEQDTGAARIPPEGLISGPVLLIRTGGGREGEVIALGGDVLTIGRSPHSDLFLDDVTVSRHHARVMADDIGFLVEDLNSLNGTYVNRKRIERHQLSDGDELQIGKFKLAFLEQEDDLL